jgi:hypothetical protein
MNFNITHRLYDIAATISAGGVVAVALSDLDVLLKIVVGALTSVFLILGIVIRARELRGKRMDGSKD